MIWEKFSARTNLVKCKCAHVLWGKEVKELEVRDLALDPLGPKQKERSESAQRTEGPDGQMRSWGGEKCRCHWLLLQRDRSGEDMRKKVLDHGRDGDIKYRKRVEILAEAEVSQRPCKEHHEWEERRRCRTMPAASVLPEMWCGLDAKRVPGEE